MRASNREEGQEMSYDILYYNDNNELDVYVTLEGVSLSDAMEYAEDIACYEGITTCVAEH